MPSAMRIMINKANNKNIGLTLVHVFKFNSQGI